MQTEDVFGRIDSNKGEAVEMLKDFASQPSVSASGQGIRECALLTEGLLAGLGADPRTFDIGEGSPVVAGEIKSKSNPGTPLLFYTPYAVQPPEPLELWASPPFQPTVRDG